MNSIVRERAARRIYVAYMNIKYEYQSVVLAACCSPLPRTEEGTGHNVPIPCAHPAGIAHLQGKAAAGGLGYLQWGGKNSLSLPPPSVPHPPANPQPTGSASVPSPAVPTGTETHAGAVLALHLPRGQRETGDTPARG